MLSLKSLAIALLITAMSAWPAWVLPGQPATAATRLDPYGDALPQGAVARFGTIRLRAYIQSFAFAPDGKTFASGGDDRDPSIRIWDVATGKEVRQYKGHTARIVSLSYLAGGEKLASVCSDGAFCIWDVATGRELRTVHIGKRLVCAALARDGGSLITVDDDGTIHVSDLATGKETASLGEHQAKGTRVVLCPDGSHFATCGTGDVIVVWDIRTAKALCRIATGQENLGTTSTTAVIFSTDGKRIATAGSDAVIIEWDAETGRETGRYRGAKGVVGELAYSPDGRRFVATGGNGVMHVWGVATHQELRQLDVGVSGVKNMKFSADGKLLAAAQGAVIRLWDLWTNKELHVYGGCTSSVTDLRFTTDGRSVITCEYNSTARRFSAATGVETASWIRPLAANYKMLALPDGSGVVTPSPQGITRVDLAAASSAASTLVSMPKSRLLCQAVSADGKILVGTGTDNIIRFWDAQSGNAKGQLEGSNVAYQGYALSADGALFAACGIQCPVCIWDVATAKLVVQFDVKNDIPLDGGGRFEIPGADVAAFAPDGKSLLTMVPQTLLWEVATGGQRLGLNTRKMRGAILHCATCGAFSPDGFFVVIGTSDGALIAVDTATGKVLGRLEGHRGRVCCLAFAPDGKTVASGGEDASVVVWDVAALVAKARPAPAEIKPEQLRELWKDLADPDAATAYKAICTMAAAPKPTAMFVKARLLGADNAQGERIAQLIRDLDDPKFAVRDKAQSELASYDDLAIPLLLKVLEGMPSAEVRGRVENLLAKLKPANTVLRIDRALEALERSGAKEAVNVLEDLAKGATVATIKEKANAAFQRLSKRSGG